MAQWKLPANVRDPHAAPVFINVDIDEAALAGLRTRAPGLFEVTRKVTG